MRRRPGLQHRYSWKSSGWRSRNHILDPLPRPVMIPQTRSRGPRSYFIHVHQSSSLELVLSQHDRRAQLPEDKLQSQLQVRGKQGQVPPCQSSHREGWARLGPHWFLAGTCAHLVPVSLLYHSRGGYVAQRASLQAWCLLGVSTAQESMPQAPPFLSQPVAWAKPQGRREV